LRRGALEMLADGGWVLRKNFWFQCLGVNALRKPHERRDSEGVGRCLSKMQAESWLKSLQEHTSIEAGPPIAPRSESPLDRDQDVVRLGDLSTDAAIRFLTGFGLALVVVPNGADIPGSYWGSPEAGLIGGSLYVRPDTPVHSVLHTACHWICLDESRRASFHTDAGSDDLEEVGVCYLQCLLADELIGYSRQRVFVDMDLWGYTFRLGSAKAWFENDAEDARAWLVRHGLIAE
jgi:hypothetical protein